LIYTTDLMIKALLQTDADYVCAFLRTVAGIIIWPYGMQKLFGWFGGVGVKGTLEEMSVKKIPKFIAYLVIIGQSFGALH
jgi:putative oxidoreductase